MIQGVDGTEVRRIRKLLGLTQAEFGKAFGMTQNVVSDVERGRRSLPTQRYERPVFSEYFGNPPAEEFARLQNLTPDELEAEGKEWQENRKRRRGPYSTD